MRPGEVVTPADDAGASFAGRVPPVDISVWDWTLHNGAQLQMSILNIDVPVIGAVNGPALTHADLVVQSDMVICTDTTVFADQAHFEAGLFAPGDGVSLIWPQLIGVNRGRYFLLTAAAVRHRGAAAAVPARDRPGRVLLRDRDE